MSDAWQRDLFLVVGLLVVYAVGFFRGLCHQEEGKQSVDKE